MKCLFLFSVVISMLLCGCAATPEKIDLFAAPGMEKQNDLFPGKLFQPYSKVIKPYGKSYLLKNPDQMPVFYMVFQGVTLQPNDVYELKMRYIGQEGIRFLISGSEYFNGAIQKNHVLLNTTSFLNVNGAATYTKQFAVTKDCEQLIPSLSVISPGKKGNPTPLLVEELSIVKVGTMKKASTEIRKINIASDYDFSKYPEGDFNKIHKGNGKNAKKWSNIKAEIVNLNGEKVLHIVRTPQNYIYPFMNLKPFPIDPKYHYVKFTFKVKGSGNLQPGLWWKRASLNWDYYHGREVKLTDQWQEVTVLHPCMTPDVKSATISFTSRDDGEYWIKDISVTMQ